MKSPVNTAKNGNAVNPCEKANSAKIPESAPAGPTTLYLLPAKNEYTKPAQIAVRIPCKGVAPEAIAKDNESGIEISATVSPDFQLDRIFSEENIDDIEGF